jgi:hypothetical protein
MNPNRRREVVARIDALEQRYANARSSADVNAEAQVAFALIGAGRGRLEDYKLVIPKHVWYQRRGIISNALEARMRRRLFGRDCNYLSVAARITSYLPEEPLPRRLVDEFRDAVARQDHAEQRASAGIGSASLDLAILGGYDGPTTRYLFREQHDKAFTALDEIYEWTTYRAEYNRFLFAQREQLPYLTLYDEEQVEVWGPFAELVSYTWRTPQPDDPTPLEALDQVIANYHEQLDDPNRPHPQEGLSYHYRNGLWLPGHRPQHLPGEGPDPNDHLDVIAPLETQPTGDQVRYLHDPARPTHDEIAEFVMAYARPRALQGPLPGPDRTRT